MKNKIYTIGREFASGGRTIGKHIAEKLDIPYLDSELLARAAKESGLCEEILMTHDEKPTTSLLYSIVFDAYTAGGVSTGGFTDMPLNHKVFLAQFDTIKKIAAEGPCVIVGRCADYALADRDDVVSTFIHAPIEERIKHIMASDSKITAKRAKDMCIKNDKKRASYYNYYTSKHWGEAKGYDICLDSSKLGLEKCAELIMEFGQRMK